MVKQVPHNKGQSVLDTADFAKTQYTARFFFVQKQMKLWAKQNPQASINKSKGYAAEEITNFMGYRKG
jgi:hypothetical protein